MAKFEEEDKTDTLGKLQFRMKTSLQIFCILYPTGRDGFYGWMGFGGSGRVGNIAAKMFPNIDRLVQCFSGIRS